MVGVHPNDVQSEAETVLEGEADCPSDDEFIQALIRSNVADSGAVVEMINRGCS